MKRYITRTIEQYDTIVSSSIYRMPEETFISLAEKVE